MQQKGSAASERAVCVCAFAYRSVFPCVHACVSVCRWAPLYLLCVCVCLSVFEEARIYTYIKGGRPEEACNQPNCKVVFFFCFFHSCFCYFSGQLNIWRKKKDGRRLAIIKIEETTWNRRISERRRRKKKRNAGGKKWLVSRFVVWLIPKQEFFLIFVLMTFVKAAGYRRSGHVAAAGGFFGLFWLCSQMVE